jgi:hypothetical protein
MYHKNQTMGYDELIGYGLVNTQGKRWLRTEKLRVIDYRNNQRN